MRAVGVRELKDNLSEYLRLVAEGEAVLVTNRDAVIAMLGPPPAYVGPEVSETPQQAMARLARAGLVRPATGEPPSASLPLPPPLDHEVDLQAELDAARERAI